MRNLLELHEIELRAFLFTWRRFKEAGLPMPETHGNGDYASIDRLGGHVLNAARQCLVRVTEWLDRPATDLDMRDDVTSNVDAFAEGVFDAFRRHLAEVTDEQISAYVHRTRAGKLMSIDLMLEHLVVHPMRHRIQLDRILSGRA